MLSVNRISKSYGAETVLKDISFTINRGERLSLIGPNGCGKTTLLRIIAGIEMPDSGSLRFTPANLRVGYLPQGLVPGEQETIGAFLGLDWDGMPLPSREIERLATDLARFPDRLDLQQAYDLALNQLEIASERANRISEMLSGLGLEKYPFRASVSKLSGGQKTRLALVKVLLLDPQLLLLDEPTNHLDIEMLEWLEDWLHRFKGGVLFVSHDRAFLDNLSTAVLEIDPGAHTARQYIGNYSAYLDQKLAEQERQRQAFKDQREEIARLQAAVAATQEKARFKKGGKGDSGDKFARGFYSDRTRLAIRRAKHIEARIERLRTEERIDKPRSTWQMKLEFPDTPTSGREVLILEDLAIGYGKEILLKGITLELRYGARAVLTGPNGAGKTTLLRTIAGYLPPLAGSCRLGVGVRVGYMTQEQEELNPALNAFETVRRAASFTDTEARTFLHRFLFSGDEVFIPAGSLSYGERARLSLACLVAQGCNFLLLDEPINHLDIPSRARFEQALADFNGTALAVVHDRFFIAGFASEIWQVREGSLQRVWLE